MRFILLGLCRGSKIKKPGASRQAWRRFVLCLRTGLVSSGAIGFSVATCSGLTHAPLLGWTMPHVIGFNSLDIFLYMVLDVADCCRHSSPDVPMSQVKTSAKVKKK